MRTTKPRTIRMVASYLGDFFTSQTNIFCDLAPSNQNYDFFVGLAGSVDPDDDANEPD